MPRVWCRLEPTRSDIRIELAKAKRPISVKLLLGLICCYVNRPVHVLIANMQIFCISDTIIRQAICTTRLLSTSQPLALLNRSKGLIKLKFIILPHLVWRQIWAEKEEFVLCVCVRMAKAQYEDRWEMKLGHNSVILNHNTNFYYRLLLKRNSSIS